MTGPFHAITCTEDMCDPGCVRGRLEGLPRDPDLAEPIWGQVDIFALLEEDAS